MESHPLSIFNPFCVVLKVFMINTSRTKTTLKVTQELHSWAEKFLPSVKISNIYIYTYKIKHENKTQGKNI